jgi:hypothetical protein
MQMTVYDPVFISNEMEARAEHALTAMAMLALRLEGRKLSPVEARALAEAQDAVSDLAELAKELAFSATKDAQD